MSLLFSIFETTFKNILSTEHLVSCFVNDIEVVHSMEKYYRYFSAEIAFNNKIIIILGLRKTSRKQSECQTLSIKHFKVFYTESVCLQCQYYYRWGVFFCIASIDVALIKYIHKSPFNDVSNRTFFFSKQNWSKLAVSFSNL